MALEDASDDEREYSSGSQSMLSSDCVETLTRARPTVGLLLIVIGSICRAEIKAATGAALATVVVAGN